MARILAKSPLLVGQTVHAAGAVFELSDEQLEALPCLVRYMSEGRHAELLDDAPAPAPAPVAEEAPGKKPRAPRAPKPPKSE